MTSKIDSALAVTERYVDYYLPPIDGEQDSDDEDDEDSDDDSGNHNSPYCVFFQIIAGRKPVSRCPSPIREAQTKLLFYNENKTVLSPVGCISMVLFFWSSGKDVCH